MIRDCDALSLSFEDNGVGSSNFDVREMWGSRCFELNQQQQQSSEADEDSDFEEWLMAVLAD